MGNPDAELGHAMTAIYHEAFTTMPAPLVVLDAELRILDVNDAYLLMLGLHRQTLLGRYLFEVFPASPEAAQDAVTAESVLREAIATGTSQYLPVFQYDTETTLGSALFERRWWQMTATPLLGDVLEEALTAVPVAGPPGTAPPAQAVLYRLDEVTEAVLARQRATAAEAEAADLAQREERLAQVVATMTSAFFTLDHHWHLTYVNTALEDLLGLPEEQLVGALVWDLPAVVSSAAAEQAYRDAAATGAVHTYELALEPAPATAPQEARAGTHARTGPAPGSEWYEGSVHPSSQGVAVYLTEVSDRHHAQQAARVSAQAAHHSAAQQAALVSLAQDLGETTTHQQVLTVVADRGVQLLDAAGAGLCLHQEGAAVVTVLSTADFAPDVRDQVQQLLADFPMPIVHTAVTGQPHHLRDRAAAVARFPGAADLYDAAGMHASVAVPLRTGGHLLGALSFGFTVERDWPTGEQNLLAAFATLTAQALQRIDAREAERAARAAEQAASARVAGIAETLQRSMLTAPPEPDHLQIAVRYTAAAEAAEVGGDWYDAFVNAEGMTSVVIGDVTGHDMRAAAVMGQYRNLLRALGYTIGQPPAKVLAALDRAVAGLGVDTLATVILAQVEQDEAHRAAGTRLLRWSNAGHLPPLLINADGRARFLDDADSDLVIGWDASIARHDHEVVLGPGETVLLFTDGLVERRRVDIRDGLAWLAQAVTKLAGEPLEELCDALLARVEGHLDDDVALVALRAHPEDEPRPAEAGPVRLPAAVAEQE